MSEREQLLTAICTHPEENTPRLVFADWLQENGEPDRAAFIRAQVRFASVPRHTPEWSAQHKAIRQKWSKHIERWLAELPVLKGVLWGTEFTRGFVEYVRV